MSRVTKKQFLLDVRHEVEMLKQHTTEFERSKLDRFRGLDPTDPYRCIYGQLAGVCFNFRARELMNLCCTRVFDCSKGKPEDDFTGGVKQLKNRTFTEVRRLINGEYKKQTWEKPSGVQPRAYRYLSSLEGYICLKGANNEGIVDYIRGFTDTLEL
jgi:hypothetical protein